MLPLRNLGVSKVFLFSGILKYWLDLKVFWERNGMKAKLSHDQPLETPLSADEQVRLEIQIFLTALQSYPDRAAKEPNITFEQHLYSLVAPRRNQMGFS
jgi:hypothetical protein